MVKNQDTSDSFNSARTNLLLLAYNELLRNKKDNKIALINSKNLSEAENYFCSKNIYIVSLKEENFMPNNIPREVFQTNTLKNKVIYKSPDSILKNLFKKLKTKPSSKNLPTVDIKNNPLNNNHHMRIEFQLLDKKADISEKKNEYFRKKTLKLRCENIKESK